METEATWKERPPQINSPTGATEAPVTTVETMWDMYLKHAATETEEKLRGRVCQALARNRQACLRSSYEDDRDLTPWGIDCSMRGE